MINNEATKDNKIILPCGSHGDATRLLLQMNSIDLCIFFFKKRTSSFLNLKNLHDGVHTSERRVTIIIAN
jgi:hypothetical protein